MKIKSPCCNAKLHKFAHTITLKCVKCAMLYTIDDRTGEFKETPKVHYENSTQGLWELKDGTIHKIV